MYSYYIGRQKCIKWIIAVNWGWIFKKILRLSTGKVNIKPNNEHAENAQNTELLKYQLKDEQEITAVQQQMPRINTRNKKIHKATVSWSHWNSKSQNKARSYKIMLHCVIII